MKFLCRNPKDFFKISRDDEYSLREFPGKALIGVLFQKDKIYQQFLRHLETIEVEIELESEIYKFDSTDYYQEEMGSGLYRSFLSLKGLYPVEQSVSLKNETNSWENEWKEAGKRTLNLDPGYLDLHKVVLLSGKEGPQNGDESGRIILLPKLVPRVLIPVLLHKNLGKPGKDRGEILHSVSPHLFPKESPPKPDHGQLA